MNDEKMNYERARVFLATKTPVHIVKKNGTFYNGIIDSVSEGGDFFFINDLKEGRKLIFFLELNREIEEYTSK